MATLLTFLLFIHLASCSEPLFKNLIQLTHTGDHSFPSFSRDGRFVFFTAKNGPYSQCEHVYRLDRQDPSNTISLFSTGIGRESQSRQIGPQYATVSTAIKELDKIVNSENIDVNSDMLCPEPKCKSQEDENARDICTKLHLERLVGSTVLRFTDSGILTNLNNQIDINNGWVSNEAFHEEGQKSFGRIYSMSCDQGECITIEDQSGVYTMDNDFGWWDGFTQYNSSKSKENDVDLAFVGSSIDDYEIELVKLGVIPLNGSKIYKTTFKSLIHKIPHPFIDDLNSAFLYPVFDPSNGDIIATRINLHNRSKTLVRINNSGSVTVMPTNTTSNYFHASVSEDGKKIVFVSDMSGKGNQVFLGSLNDPKTKQFKTKPFLDVPSPTKYFNETRTFCNMANDEVLIKPKLSDDGQWLMYGMTETINSCNQIYQLNLKNNDTSMPRKMTSGMHHFESPNFLGLNGTFDILYAGTLTKEINPENIDKSCRTKKCYTDSELYKNNIVLQNLCSKVGIEKGLDKTSDIYIANQYGHIKKRLTKTQFYAGEPAVSPDFKTVIFSQEGDDDYDLFQMNINGTGLKKLTNHFGFEGGVVFSQNGKYIAFYAYRPTKTDEIERFAQMKGYGFTDLQQTQIYIYNLDSGVETQVTKCDRCHSPAFLPTNDQLLFINEFTNKTKFLMSIDLVDFKDGDVPKVEKLDTLNHNLCDMAFGQTLKNFVYVSHSMKNIYELTLGTFDDKIVNEKSSAFQKFSHFEFIILSLLLLLNFL